MKTTVLFLLLLLCAVCCTAQTNDAAQPNVSASADGGSQSGLVPLAPPYTISTAPHFAVLVQFPRRDSIRRIALGDSNYFLAEADKDDPHYAIVKQIRASGPKANPPIETNMLVYLSSGRVVNITLKAGKLEDTAYSIDYPVPTVQPKDDPPPVPPEELAKKRSDEERSELAEKMIAEVQKTPKSQAGVVSGGLDLRFYTLKRFGALALVSFDVENTSSEIIDLEDPRINIVTAAENPKDRKKAPAKVEPVALIQSIVSAKQLAPGARAVCLVEFNPPVHDSDQQVVLSIANRAMADKPATYRLE